MTPTAALFELTYETHIYLKASSICYERHSLMQASLAGIRTTQATLQITGTGNPDLSDCECQCRTATAASKPPQLSEAQPQARAEAEARAQAELA